MRRRYAYIIQAYNVFRDRGNYATNIMYNNNNPQWPPRL